MISVMLGILVFGFATAINVLFWKLKLLNSVVEDYKSDFVDSILKFDICEDCGGIFKKNTMKLVVIRFSSWGFNDERKWYCNNCSPKYDERIIGKNVRVYIKNHVEVCENGKIKKRGKNENKKNSHRGS